MRFDNSEPCSVSQLDLLSMPSTQSVLNHGVWTEIVADGDYQSGSVIFKIVGDDNFLDLSENELILQVSIRKEDNIDATKSSPLLRTDKIGPINNFISSIFSQCQVSISGKEVENSNATYPFRAYLENLTNYDHGAKNSWLQTELFYKDEAGRFDSTNLETIPEEKNDQGVVTKHAIPPNLGYIKRRKIFEEGQIVELKGKLHSNMFNINKYILSKTNIEVKLSRSKSSFCLFGDDSADKFKIHIHSARLRVRKVEVNASIANTINTALETKNAIYPYKHVEMRTATISVDSQKVELQNLHDGIVPNLLIVAMIDTDAFSGKHNKNPFNFKHYNVTEMLPQVGGINMPYSNSLQFDFEKGNYCEAYNTLFKSIAEFPNDISYSEYSRGNSIFAFKFTPDLCNNSHFNDSDSGKLTLKITFKENLRHPVTLIAYMEFDNVLQLTKGRVPIINPI